MASRTQQTSEHNATLSGVTKVFTAKGRTVHAVKDVSLQIDSGEYLVILGPSGCGKSTLLRCVAGLETPTEGSISLGGRYVYDNEQRIDVRPNARNVGMVFQNYALWPHMTVEKNITYPLRARKVPKRQWRQTVDGVLAAVECEALAQRLPAELSGGQQQRVALARALVYEPAIMLLDEPLSNLDALLRVTLRAELLRLHRKLGYTALHITHDQEEALEMADRVVLMREGSIEQIGVPEEVYARPVSPYAAYFLGVRNRLPSTAGDGLLHSDAGVITGSEDLAAVCSQGESVELFARSRDTEIRLAQDTNNPTARPTVALNGTLAQIVLSEGGRRQYIVDVGDQQWFAQRAVGEEALSVGDLVTVSVNVSSTLLYRAEELVYPAPSADAAGDAR